MAAVYQWRATTRYQSDTSLSYGVTPATQSAWQDATPGVLSGSWTFWYRDANVASGGVYSDSNSSRVALALTESWNATINENNYLTVTVSVTLNSIVRDDLRGSNTNTPGRNINIYREEGASPILSLTDTQLATAHVIWSGPLAVDTYTFTLAPGQNLERSSLYLHNQTIGYPSYDDIWFGVQFKNTLPADYRPGKIIDNNNTWQSHNRTGGADNVYNGSSWQTMRTANGGSGQGNPPIIRHSSNWYNERKIGNNAS